MSRLLCSDIVISLGTVRTALPGGTRRVPDARPAYPAPRATARTVRPLARDTTFLTGP
ncbi:hypothetical protein [Streptomyces sp. enrichment culture]|uniref:hypothetical protein n=1 Tax=Streptomyces sp. enrichment culture TaxID=1795815 RepID=UPI003F555221